jgi:hypothetical protein
MKAIINRILAGFEYPQGEFIYSLLPTIKYNLMIVMLTVSFTLSWVDKIFGLNALAVLALMLVMLLELFSGTYASKIKQETFSSRKLSRFTFKAACYMVLIAIPYLFYASYHERGNNLAAGFFEWLHVFLVVQIVIENIISILENIAVIQGKPKTFWIDKIRGKVNSSL